GCYQLLLLLAEIAAQPALGGHGATPSPGEVRQALYLLERAAMLNLKTRSYHFRKASYLTLLGDREAASREVQEAETVKPTGAADAFLFGRDLFLDEKAEAAAEAFRVALQEQPSDFWSRLFLAACYLNLAQPRKAEEQLHTCRKQRPDFVMVDLLLGH